LPAQKKKDVDAGTRALQGIVFDPEGNPVVQAVVQLKDSRTLQVISFITKEDGAYHFAGLKQDVEYQVKAEHLGLSTDWKRLSIFDTRKIAEMNLKLTKKAEKQEQKQ
jgi:Carboxypeptidase regulatory-like domain